ncbi:alpha-L-arabinofuranosidase, partial [bacterium]
SLKKVGDWAFCEGINQMVFHVNIAQPEETRPGISAWFGTEFNRNNTWFPEASSWVDYLKRCHYLLQQGKPVADVAYFIGEDVPKMSGIQSPKLPKGYSYDYINAEVINTRLTVKNGRFVLPDGMSYRLIVLPKGTSMRPETLAKLRSLVKQGGAVLGEPPAKSPSLQNYPACDTQIQVLAKEMWGKADGVKVKAVSFGLGHVFRGANLQSVLTQLNSPPDFNGAETAAPGEVLFAHRRVAGTDIYFLSNQSDNAVSFTSSFRIAGKAPELWDPISGQCQPLAVYDMSNGRTSFPLRLTGRGSTFVVFRAPATPSRIVKITRDNQPVLTTQATSVAKPVQETFSTFTVSLWAKPGIETTMPKETQTGFSDLYTSRNDVITATSGDSFGLGQGYAGNGLAVGTNGVVVYEHSGKYFVPILAHPAPIKDWTHIAVTYDRGQTRLYLNGRLARTGLKTSYKVRPGEPKAAFNGRI